MRTFFFLAVGASLGALVACNTTINPGETTGAGGTATSASSASGTSSQSSASGTGGAAPCPIPETPQPFELGTGESCFERVASMQTVSVIQGPQGGYHLWLAVGCGDCSGKRVLAFGVKDPKTGLFFDGTAESKLVVDFNATGWQQRAGFTAFLPGIVWDTMSALPKGAHVVLAASILDEAMSPIHQAEVELVLGDIVMWSPPCDPGPTCGAPGSLPCCTDTFGDAGP